MSKQIYRITWRHEVYLEAEDPQDLKKKWESLILGHLDVHHVSIVDGLKMKSHDFVELMSVEDEDNNEVDIESIE